MAGKRGNNEGSIAQRKDGRWEARVSLPNGKRKSIYGKKYEDVRKQMNQVIRDAEEGVLPVDERQTVQQYLTSWLDIRKHRVDASSIARYRRYLKAAIDAFGSTTLAKLKPQQIQKLYAELLDKGWAASTVESLHKTLSSAYKDAVKMGAVQKSIMRQVVAPRPIEKEMQVLNPEQAKQLLAGAQGERFEAVYAVVLSTGLRAGEVFALQWKDIDFNQHTLTIRSAWQRAGTKYIMTQPKTRRSRRIIALSQLAIDALMKHRARLEQESIHAGSLWSPQYDLVFPNFHGKVIDFTNFTTKHLHPLLRKLNLPEIRFHDLRHTAATLLLGAGVNIKVVSEMLGHSNITITLRTYAHAVGCGSNDGWFVAFIRQ
jgi:integrase